MKEFKLISMTDFVLAQNYTTTLDMSQIDFYDRELSILSKIRNYAKFLSRPLELWMFVPVDKDGNVLENPDNHQQKYKDRLGDFYLEKYKDDYKNYKQAKKRVLFEGFEVKESVYDETGQSLFIGWESYNPAIFLKLKGEDWKLDDFKTIEDLVEFDLTLTPTAIKEIEI